MTYMYNLTHERKEKENVFLPIFLLIYVVRPIGKSHRRERNKYKTKITAIMMPTTSIPNKHINTPIHLHLKYIRIADKNTEFLPPFGFRFFHVPTIFFGWTISIGHDICYLFKLKSLSKLKNSSILP